MRLWHYELISYLPNKQLLAQWRELNSIFKKQDKHILINYVYEYEKENLFNYSLLVIFEMKKRNFRITSYVNFCNYFNITLDSPLEVRFDYNPFPRHHNFRYLQQCYFNLEEKYDRGQKDFTAEQFNKLQDFFNKEYLKYLKGGK